MQNLGATVHTPVPSKNKKTVVCVCVRVEGLESIPGGLQLSISYLQNAFSPGQSVSVMQRPLQGLNVSDTG